MSHVIAVDLADVGDEQADHLTTLAWGDAVDVLSENDKHVTVAWTTFREEQDGTRTPVPGRGRICKRGRAVVVPADQAQILKVAFVDVQQGDGAIIETPDGKVILIDGGDNQLFARYLAGRYRGTSDAEPKQVEAIVVSLGDADHFEGLSEIRDSEQNDNPLKRLFLHPERVFHNGLVKGPSALRDVEQFGATARTGEHLLAIDLVDDVRDVDDARLNRPFKRWKRTLEHWAKRGPIEMRRLQAGDDDAFDFLADEDVQVEVLAPIPETHDGHVGLPFLGEPERHFGHPSKVATSFGAPSASHTINGHSIVLRFTYKHWRMMFAGDLNEQAEQALVDGPQDLGAEVLKVPHHGSADFLPDFLEAVKPVVSVISCGDESKRKEYIHPRATLIAGLGRHSRTREPVIFITELVAFFSAEKFVKNVPPPGDKSRDWSTRTEPFFAFSREAFGLVRVRTDGTRLLVYTDSGKVDMKEAYVFTLEADGTATPQEPVRV